MTNMWMVRSGYKSFLIDDFLKQNVVAIDWDVGDLSDKSPEEIKKLLKQKYHNKNKVDHIYPQINAFISRIKVGDYIITHNYGEKTYFLGKITSDYKYEDKIKKVDTENNNYWSIRDVEWLMEIPKNILKKSTKATLTAALTVFNINENAEYNILEIYEKTFSSEGKIWSMNVAKKPDYEEAWNLFKNDSCVSIDYFIDNKDNDYSAFSSTEEIKKFLNDEKTIQPDLINRFVNKMDKGDILIAHKGNSTLAGIGFVLSDYIYQQNETLKQVRKIDWIYTPDDLELKEGSFFKPHNIVRLDELYPRFVNEIFARIAGKDENIRKNLLSFLFNQYYENYYSTVDGKNHFDGYDIEKEYIQHHWEIIQEKDSKNEDFTEDIWEDIFRRNVGVIGVGVNNLKKLIQGKNKFTDEQMSKSAILFYKTVNNLLSTSSIDEQKKILSDYSQNKFSKDLGIGRLSPILFYLNDKSFYPINKKTLLTYKFLSLALGSEEELSDNLKDYIDSNCKYQYLLNDLSDEFSFDKCDIGDVKVFDQFSHWICAVDDYLRSKKVKMLPLNILRSGSKPTFESDEKRNKIYFGAPGTGKSYNLNQDKNDLLEDFEDNYERVTFHPDYSYANFVGTYKPVPKDTSITYKFVPGPFMRVLKKALSKPSEPFLLIIEEINRSNVAAVFGDVFQLLDREDNESMYPIDATEDMRSYLNEDKVIIPQNMFVWATMNSADQGVFPMDTAFKRRWDFKYFSINHNENLIENTHVIINEKPLNWNTLRKQINAELLSYKLNEDKLLGPFFAFNEFINEEIPIKDFKDIFKNKIIMYLFEDAARSRRNELFRGACNIKDTKNITYSEICELIDEDKILEIFPDSFQEDEE